jgi:hypothetical protein
MLALPVLGYAFWIHNHFWEPPAPSDPLQYLGSAVWGTTYGYWPWLDRIVLAVNLRVFSLLFDGQPLTSAYYVGSVNVAILSILVWWAYRKSGRWGGLLAGLFGNLSYLFLAWGTTLYPDQTVALFALLAYTYYFAAEEPLRPSTREWGAGFLSALAVLSKITGAAVVVFFAIYLLRNRPLRSLGKYAAGLACGAGFAVAAFVACYNWPSFTNVVQLFFKNTISQNLTIGLIYGNASYYHTLLLRLEYFPFILLLLLPEAYKEAHSRRLLLFSWACIGVMLALRQTGPSIPTYFYTAHVFAIAGVAIYLGDALKNAPGDFMRGHRWFFIGGGTLLLLFHAGLAMGMDYPPIGEFDYGYNYLRPLDVYDSDHRFSYPANGRLMYALAPTLILALILTSQVFHSRLALAVFLVVGTFFLAFSNGALAFQKTKYERIRNEHYYRYAQLMTEVPNRQFSVYVQELQQYPNSGDCLLWVYRIFFDEKFSRVSSQKFDAQYLHENEIITSVAIISSEGDLLSKLKGTQILTDSAAVILRHYPGAKTVKTLSSKGRELAILDISDQASIEIRIRPQTTQELAFPPLGATESISNETPDALLLAPLRNLGIRGEFGFRVNEETGQSHLEVRLHKMPPTEAPTLNLGFMLGTNEIGEGATHAALEGEIYVDGDGTHSLFVQDEAVGWARSSKEIKNRRQWVKCSFTIPLRPGFSQVAAGICLSPKSVGECIRIRNLKISVGRAGH